MSQLKKYILGQVQEGKLSPTDAKEMILELSDSEYGTSEIAIIGISGKFPGARNLDEFWDNLRSGICSIDKIPLNRLEDLQGKVDTENKVLPCGGFLDEIDKFDPAFFRISPKEALYMEPMQRLFLQTAYEAVEDAGYGGNKIIGTNTGVYLGNDSTNVSPYKDMLEADELTATGSWNGILATRISYIFNLNGPGMVVDTACSSGATAVHMACQALKAKECEMAIAGGICLIYYPEGQEQFSALKLVESADGTLRAFDKDANGSVWGEGVGAVILKPLSKAIKDRDNIYAVIKGSALNNDGASNGITAPNAVAQENLLVEAWKCAKVDPKTISYVEAHGTGTILGDPIEVKALNNAFLKYTNEKHFCRIGSVKTNIGHTVAASGIASLLKVVLAMKYGELPASLNYKEANPYINFEDSAVKVNDSLTRWVKRDFPRRAGINSFGFSGTNCHIVLEEAPEIKSEVPQRENTVKILLLSAMSKSALKEIINKYRSFIGRVSLNLEDVCFTANTGRGHYNFRLAMVFNSENQLKEQLDILEKRDFDNPVCENGIYYGEYKVVSKNTGKLENGDFTEDEQKVVSEKAAALLKENGDTPFSEDFLYNLAELYIKGADVPWDEFYKFQNRRRVSIPVYPFDRVRYWPNIIRKNIEAGKKKTDVSVSGERKAQKVELSGKGKGDYTPLEYQIAQIWGRELGIKEVNINDDFYELGGDSIIAIKVANSISQILENKFRVTMDTLLEYGTISDLANHIEEMEGEVNKVEIEMPKTSLKTQEYYNLSHNQKRIWLLQKLDPNMVVYNVSGTVPLEFEVDVDILRKSINALICRHEMLRAVFVELGGEPKQRILPKYEYYMEVIDLTEKEDFEDALITLIRELNKKPSDLSAVPPFEIKLFKCAKDKYKLYINIHHIITDGWSMPLIMNELMEIYQRYVKGLTIDLSAARFDYTDWIGEQEKWEKSEDFVRQSKYWQHEISKPLSVLNLPVDKQRPQMQTYNGGHVTIKLDKSRTENLKRLAKTLNVTLHMALMAQYFLLLNKITNDEDIIIGFPITGRDNKEVESIVGLFVNTLCIRVKFDELTTFKDLVLYVKEKCLRAYQNSKYPFELLVSDINPERDLSRNPIFSTVFQFYNDISSGNDDVSAFDLCLYCREVGKENIEIRMEYNSDIFKKETIRRFTGYFKNLINKVSGNVEIALSEIDLLSDEDRYRILFDFNNTKTEYPNDKNIHELFEEQARKTPDNIAIGFEDKFLTYKELNHKANQLARILRKKGVEPEDAVGIMLERSMDMVISILAVLKAGGAYLPLDPKYPHERICYILKESNTKLVISNLEVELDDGFEKICITDDLLYGEDCADLKSLCTPKSLAYIMYTSGSTGKPKGVMVEHRSVIRLVKNTNYIDLKEEDKLLLTGAIVFDATTFEIWGSLLNGMELYIVSEEVLLDVEKLYTTIDKLKINTMWLTSPLFNQISTYKPEIFKNIKNLLVGGDKLSPKHINNVRRICKDINIINGYGPTENTTFSTCFSIDKDYEDEIPIGRPISNSTAYIVDKNLKLSPIGIIGELCVGGDGLARGYLNNTELTSEKFIKNQFFQGERIYRTGDYARWLPDGNIEFIGRMDHQVKIRGFRIEIGEIESTLLKHGDVRECVVIARDDKNSGTKYLCAYYMAERELSVNELREHLAKELPDFMIPSYFVKVDKMILNVNGKIDKNALPMPETSIKTGQQYEAPRNSVEIKLVDIWEKVLGTCNIGINDNFFLLGGDSIKAIQVSARLQNEGLKIDLPDLFKNPTIAKLSSLVKQVAVDISQDSVFGTAELTPIQHWFFELPFPDRNHFNQSVMLYRKTGFDEKKILSIFEQIVSHHDALRMVYREEENIVQYNRDLEGNLFDFETVDFTNEIEFAGKVEEIANKLQQSFDIGKGPLVKLRLFKTMEGDHLLIIIHHLVVDGISWRIILEDLAAAYEGDLAQIPKKTHSFKEWSIRLKEFSNSEEFLKEKEYWKNIETQAREISKTSDVNLNSSDLRKDMSFNLSVETTEKLLTQVNAAYNTQINDILLVAFGIAMAKVTGEKKVLVELEGHGREPIISGININRTVGWFTTIFPVILDMSSISDLPYLIKQTKEDLRRIPNYGIGYGILKYLTSPENKQALDFGLNSDISFNYLGQFDREFSSDLFELSDLNAGKNTAISFNRVRKPLEIIGKVIGNKLFISADFDTNIYSETIISELMEKYLDSLFIIIEHCINKSSVELTPSDFQDEDLSIEDLEFITKQLNDL